MTASEPASMPMVALATSTAMFATSNPASTRRTARDRSRALSGTDMVCKLVLEADLVNAGQDERSMLRPYLQYLDNCINISPNGRLTFSGAGRPHAAQDRRGADLEGTDAARS